MIRRHLGDAWRHSGGCLEITGDEVRSSVSDGLTRGDIAYRIAVTPNAAW